MFECKRLLLLIILLLASPFLFAEFKPAGIFDDAISKREIEKSSELALGISFDITTPMRTSVNDKKKSGLLIMSKLLYVYENRLNALLGFGMSFSEDTDEIISLPLEFSIDYTFFDCDISNHSYRAVSASDNPLSSGVEYDKRRQHLGLKYGLGFRYYIPVNSNGLQHYNPFVNFAFNIAPFEIFPFLFEMRFSPGWSWYVYDGGEKKNNFSFSADCLFMIGLN